MAQRGNDEHCSKKKKKSAPIIFEKVATREMNSFQFIEGGLVTGEIVTDLFSIFFYESPT